MEHLLYSTEFNEHEDEFLWYEQLNEAKEFIRSISKINGRQRTRFIALSERSSHYGSICGNGNVGYGIIPNVDELFQKGDEVEVYFDDNMDKLVFKAHTHDGTDTYTIAPITKTRYNELIKMEDEVDFNEMLKITKNEVEKFTINRKMLQVLTSPSGEIKYSI